MEAALEHIPDPSSGYSPRALGTGGPLASDQLLAAPLKSLPRPSILDAPITKLKGAGPKLAEAASEMGIASLGDLLRHVPHTYRDRANPVGLGNLRLGEEATVEVEVKSAKLRPTRRRRLTILEADVLDPSGKAKAVWFNRAWLADRLQPGARLLLHGKLEKRGFNVSEHEFLEASNTSAGLHTTGIVPVHPASERIRPQKLREWVWQAAPMARHAVEPIPGRMRRELRMASATDSIVASHFPVDEHQAEAARERLAFEELFLYQAALVSRRGRRVSGNKGVELAPPGAEVAGWVESLPFSLTGDQQRALEEIDDDLGEAQPMQRLLMGEVGSGKTVLCVYAMLRAIESGHQAALMAPTETLAEQHFRTLESLRASEATTATLLTSAIPPAERRELLDSLASGQPQLVVGTHALIEDAVEFSSLAVAVVDEQHRFGVRQRAALDAKGPGNRLPHVLHMTATPIPRTLSLTAYGDLDTTALRELPKGRQPIRTRVVDEEHRAAAYEFIRERLREGRQAYVVCPLVSESELTEARAAEAEAKRLARTEFRDAKVGLLHGQMSSDEKARAMDAFVSGEAHVLVATTVIEVGIDVPNATVMLVEGAERFGLSQLHQLRGRVGRGEHESFCILFGDPESEAAKVAAGGHRGRGGRLRARRGRPDDPRRGRDPRHPPARPAPIQGGLAARGHRAAARGAPRVLELRERFGSLEAPGIGPLMDEARRRFGDERVEQVAA